MLPAYAADVGIAVLLMRFARKRGFSESAGLFLGTLAVFNPAAVILSGAHWVDVMQPGGGYIFAAAHNLQADVPPENIITMFRAARAWKQK